MVLLILISSLLFCFPAYAAPATPSEVEILDDYEELEDDPFYWEESELSDEEGYSKNLLDFDPDLSSAAQNVDYAAEDIASFALSDNNDFSRNVVVFYGRFNNYDCRLVVPYAAYASLDVVNGYIVNIGSGTVQGRILYDGDILDPAEVDTYVYNLGSVYGSTSNVYRYGSFNYRRHYYIGDRNNIVYDDMYGNFYVDDIDVYYSSSERTYYALFIIIFALGGIFLCLKRMRF